MACVEKYKTPAVGRCFAERGEGGEPASRVWKTRNLLEGDAAKGTVKGISCA